MEKEQAEKYIKAGKISKKVQKKARKLCQPGKKLIDIALDIEKEIKAQGKELDVEAKPAWPLNLSVNEEAAHATPSIEDETVFEKEHVLKVDIGVHIDGFIADSAFTLNPDNEHAKLVEASEKALENALSLVKEGVKISEIGKEIEKTIRNKGFNPVQNLSGHGLAPYLTHVPPTIPNIDNRNPTELEEGMVFAIEPFATDGKGFVRESRQSEIFALNEPVPVRNRHARKIMDFVEQEYKTLPFAERWIAKKLKLSEFQRKLALRELMKKNCIKPYPVLKEKVPAIVSQAENTVLLKDDKVKILV